MGLEPGDHLWYYETDDLTSTAASIPRQAWFPGSANETDYQGHGKEIFHYVFHSDDEIRMGQPQMRSGDGSFAWLNNNPGNLTGHPGGPDYGQYWDKFSWHNFLIFPSFQTGYDAIASFLQNPGNGYLDLNLVQAFQRYAPSGDGGNDPVAYATDVATAAAVPTSTLIGELTPEQMVAVQDKITQIEGSREGTIYSGVDQLPAAVQTAYYE